MPVKVLQNNISTANRIDYLLFKLLFLTNIIKFANNDAREYDFYMHKSYCTIFTTTANFILLPQFRISVEHIKYLKYVSIN